MIPDNEPDFGRLKKAVDFHIPWYRHSLLMLALIVVSLLQFPILFLALLPINMGLLVGSTSLVASAIALTGPVYFQERDKIGRPKKWPSVLRYIPVLVMLVWILFVMQRVIVG
jgi:hypothetical protein